MWNGDNEDEKVQNNQIKNKETNIENDIFLDLEKERKKAINNFENPFTEKKEIEPTLLWTVNIENISLDYYEQKDLFFEGLYIRLILYYEQNKNIFNLAIQHLIKNENQNENNLKEEEEENFSSLGDTIKKNSKNEEMNFTEKETNENKIISILSICKIKKINYQSKTIFNCIISNSNGKFLIFKLEDFTNYFNEKITINGITSIKFNLEVFLKRDYIFSTTLNQICQNFHNYYNLPSVMNLPRSALNLIIKNEYLKYKEENEKLICILNWLSNKSVYYQKNSFDLFKVINWSKIPSDDLVDFLMNQNQLLIQSIELKNEIFFEFHKRFQDAYGNLNNSILTNSSIGTSLSVTDTIISTNNNKNNTNQNNIQNNLNNNLRNNYFINNFTYDIFSKILSICSQYTNDGYINNNSTSLKETNSLKENNTLKEPNIINNQKEITNNTETKKKNINDIPKDKSDTAHYISYLVKRVENNSSMRNKGNVRNTNQNSSIKSKFKYGTINNNNSSLVSYHNTSGISCKNSNSNIVVNSVSNYVKNPNNDQVKIFSPKGIRANTPLNNDIIIIRNRENKYKNNAIAKTKKCLNPKAHSKSMDKTFKINTSKNLNLNNETLQKQLNSLYPKYTINNTNVNTNTNANSKINNNNQKIINSAKPRTPNNITAYTLKLRKFSTVNKVNNIINTKKYNNGNNPSLAIHPPNPTSRTEFLKTENSQNIIQKKGTTPSNIIHIRSKSNH